MPVPPQPCFSSLEPQALAKSKCLWSQGPALKAGSQVERGLGVTTKYHRTVLKIHYLSSNLPMAALPFQDISLGVILRHLSTCHLAPVLSPCLSNFPLHSSTHPCQWPLGPLPSGGDVSQREAHSPAVPKSPPTLTSEIPPGPSLTIPPFCP